MTSQILMCIKFPGCPVKTQVLILGVGQGQYSVPNKLPSTAAAAAAGLETSL